MLTFRRLTFVTVVVTLSAVIGFPAAIIARHRLAVSVLEQACASGQKHLHCRNGFRNSGMQSDLKVNSE